MAVTRAPSEIVAAVARRTAEIVAALSGLDDGELVAPSALPGWSRLTIACHLRYGAEALGRITEGTLAGRPVAYYPQGRDHQRPATLGPMADETGVQAVASLEERAGSLRRMWDALTEEQWHLMATEPPPQVDQGPVPLLHHAVLRLTEVEVHGSDLHLGLGVWSELFVEAALPFRLDRFNTRRTNHRPFDGELRGSWLLAPDDGQNHLVTVTEATVESKPVDPDADATATIAASGRDLLALLLGRPLSAAPRYSGDVEFARAFGRAFPGP